MTASVESDSDLVRLDEDSDAFDPSLVCCDADPFCAGGLRPWTSWTGERFAVCGIHAAERHLFVAALIDCLRALPDAAATKAS